MVPPLLSACTQFGLSVSQYFFDFGSSWQWSNRPPKIINSCINMSCIWPNMFSVRITTVLIQRFPFPICTGIRHILYQACPDLSKKNSIPSGSVGLNSVRLELLSSVTIVFYDKVRGPNKAQGWLLLVCWGFFIWKRYNRTHFHRTILWLTVERLWLNVR